MPYLILVIGLLIGLYTLYRFFINANIHQIKALFLTAILVTITIALFYLALTGRLPAAIGLGVAILPFLIAYLRQRHVTGRHADNNEQAPYSDTPDTHTKEIIIDLDEQEDEESSSQNTPSEAEDKDNRPVAKVSGIPRESSL